MNYIAIGVACAVLAISGYRGYKAGVMKMILYVITLIATVALAGILMKPVGAVLRDNTTLYDNVKSSVLQLLQEYDVTQVQQLHELPFPEYMLDQVRDKELVVTDSMQEAIADAIANQVFHAIVYVVLNTIIYAALRILLGAMKVVSMLPIIKELNKLAGFAVGIIQGIVILWILCILLQACGSESWAQELFLQIKESSLLNWIYNHNLLVGFLKKTL